MKNLNPLYKINNNRYKLIYEVIMRLDLSYPKASGGQKWEFEFICNGDKQLASKYYAHWKKVFRKVEDMVMDHLMFDKAYLILSTDPVLLLVQKDNYSVTLSPNYHKSIAREALAYYNMERESKK